MQKNFFEYIRHQRMDGTQLIKRSVILPITGDTQDRQTHDDKETDVQNPEDGTKEKETKKNNMRGKEKEKAFLKDFLDSIPRVPSHYCRRDSSKLYLEPIFSSKRQLLIYTWKNVGQRT